MQWPLVGRDALLEQLDTARRSGAPAAVLVGDAGVGKTRLAAECASRAEADGAAVSRVAASWAASTIPFGAFAHLLPAQPGTPGDRLALLRQLKDTLSPGSGTGPALVVVDDAHLLDDGSAALVAHLARSDATFVLVTLRQGEPVPDPVTALWKDAGAERVEIPPLDPAATGALVGEVLGAPVAAALSRRLWSLSTGYPLFLRELLLGALDSGALARDGEGAWRCSGPLLPSGRLTEIVAQRVADLPPDARRALELLAVGAPLEAPVMERLAGTQAMERLEEARLLAWTEDGARQHVEPAHPVYGEAIRAALTRSRRRALSRKLADAIEGLGMRRRDDLLRVATLRLEGGGSPDHDLLTAAAHQALQRFDHDLAERLARAALGGADGVEPRLALSEALRCQNRFEEADGHLQEAEALARSDSAVARCALARTQTLFYGLRRPDEGIAVARAARARLTDPAWRTELDALVALLATFLGDLEEAADTGARVLDETRVSPRAVVQTLVVSTIAQALLGRFEETTDHIAHGLRLAATIDEPPPLATELLQINDAVVDLLAGRIKDAETKERSGYRRAVEAGIDDLAGVWGSTLVQVLLLRGDVTGAVETGARSIGALERNDPLGLWPMTLAIHATSLAMTGDAAAARALLDHPLLERAGFESRVRLHRDRALVWVAVAERDVAAAVARACEGGTNALAHMLTAWGMLLLHDAVRLGDPAAVLEPLQATAAGVEGDLLPLLARHAEALAAADARALEAVSGAFARLGADLYAAEAAVQAAEQHARDGADRPARRCRARAARLAQRCPGADTPTLAVEAPHLTSREREVAMLAATGMPSAVIAGRLVLSARTVDNHLGSVYRKLGLRGRRDLPAALGLTEADGPQQPLRR